MLLNKESVIRTFKKQQKQLANETNVYDFSLIFPTTDEVVRHILRPLSSNKTLSCSEVPTSVGNYHYLTMSDDAGEKEVLNVDDLLPLYLYKVRNDLEDIYLVNVDEDSFSLKEAF
jgi:hypothetical protein